MRQAKAAGVWDNPKALGGRALELYAWKKHRQKRKPGEADKDLRSRIYLDELAWEDCGIKRLPGETDEQLRIRCKAKIDEEYASAPDWRTLE